MNYYEIFGFQSSVISYDHIKDLFDFFFFNFKRYKLKMIILEIARLNI